MKITYDKATEMWVLTLDNGQVVRFESKTDAENRMDQEEYCARNR